MDPNQFGYAAYGYYQYYSHQEVNTVGAAGMPPVAVDQTVINHPVHKPPQTHKKFIRHPLSHRLPPSRMCKVDNRSSRVVFIGNLPASVDDRAIRAFLLSAGGGFEIEALNHVKSNQTAFAQLAHISQVPYFIQTFHGSLFLNNQIVCSAGKPPPASFSKFPVPPKPLPSPPQQVMPPYFQPPPIHPQGGLFTSQETTTSTTVRFETPTQARFFIIKSFTQNDIAIAQTHGIWSTTLRNEGRLNDAFGSCENVFLIFSVNGSGGFTGVARMQAFAGNGLGSKGAGGAGDAATDIEKDGVKVIVAGESLRLLWDSPFPIKWLVRQFVPFRATDHLCNPWNEGKPVRIARDGTEIEPSVGYALMALLCAQDPAGCYQYY
ncbi:3'-5' RNA helicase ythdc2 [Podochytrium sp. JEL0797]|nr:3'-5' RNA helicase ythdc2 [Podochytrium sp. JEL0797]